jgi:arogenate dehydrogenase (NADP+)
LAVAQQRLAAAETELHHVGRLRILIVGFGTFGQFLAAEFARAGHTVCTSSRSDYSELAERLGASYYPTSEAAIAAHDPQVVLLCTSIL